MGENRRTLHSRVCVEFGNESGNADGDAFIRVAPYCDAPQTDKDGNGVVQRFDFASAQRLVEAFNANAKKLLNRIGFGSAAIPFYNGHPDFANASAADSARDMRVYAEAVALEARENGLWAKIRRTPFLADLTNKLGRLEISPRWLCRKDDADGTFKPVRLLSFGLVKTGNLPGADFINEKKNGENKDSMNNEQLKQLGSVLGLEGEACTAEAVISAVGALVKAKNDSVEAANEAKKSAEEKDKALTAEKARAESEKARADAETEKRKKTEKDFANMLIEKAHGEGRVLPAMREAVEKMFEADFANARQFLGTLPVLGDFSNDAEKKAKDAAKKDAEKLKELNLSRAEAGKKLNEMVNAKLDEMLKENPNAESIDAFGAVVKTKEGRELYDKATARATE